MWIFAYLTTGIDFLTLGASLWLGCFIVTHNVRSHRGFSDQELELLADLANQIAAMIHPSLWQGKNSEVIATSESKAEVNYVPLVRDGLRRLYDYCYLGEHALAQLQVVKSRLADQPEGFETHIDRGRVVSEVLQEALQKLRPEGREAGLSERPSPKSYLYTVLHDTYVKGNLNRDVMIKLNMSESNFNRTKRKAISGVARALQEIEEQVRANKNGNMYYAERNNQLSINEG